MTLDGGARVVIQLAPAFAPVHVANIRKFAAANYWRGAAVYRVQDNYVAQWGINEAKRALSAGAVAKPPAEYVRSARGSRSPRSDRPTLMPAAPASGAAGRSRSTGMAPPA